MPAFSFLKDDDHQGLLNEAIKKRYGRVKLPEVIFNLFAARQTGIDLTGEPMERYLWEHVPCVLLDLSRTLDFEDEPKLALIRGQIEEVFKQRIVGQV